MKRWSRKLVLLLAVALGVCLQAHASSTATIVVGGTAPPSDASTITISFNGFVETVRYGPYSTPTSVASAFAAMFSRDYLQQNLCASASGTLITFKLRGDSTFGALDITGSTLSFPLTSSGFASSTTQLQDTGTVSLLINGSAVATTDYGLDSTPNTIAAALAESVPANSPVNVTAYDNTLHIDAVATGTITDSITYSVYIASTNPAFTSASFSASPGGTLSGASAGGTDTATQVYSYTASYDAVSNLAGYADSVMGTWNFTPDTLNRLITAQNTATTGTSTQYANNYGCWQYDQFGNRLSQSMSTTPCTSGPPQTSWAQFGGTVNGTNNNQMSATSQNALQASGYDASGNITNDGTNQYLYDAEGRICAVANTPAPGMTTLTGYLYDAEGTRVAKGLISVWSCDPATNGFATTTDYVLGASGEQVTEMAVSGTTSTWVHTNIWAGGKLLGTYDLTGKGMHFYLDDMLGTRRVQTDYLGVVEQTCASLPFGDDLTCSGSTEAPTEHHFTGKERDAESGNDYFGARYYASSMGRFISPDWSAKAEPVPYSKLDNPQTLNLYAYMMNNPLGGVDADGHAPLSWGGFEDCSVRGDCNGGGQTKAQQVYNMITRDLADGATVSVHFTSAEQQNMMVAGQDAGGAVNPAPQNRDWTPDNYKPWELRPLAVHYLQHNQACLDWLNSGGGNAINLMATVPILLYDPKNPNEMGSTNGGPHDPIYVSSKGAFYGNSFNQTPLGGKYMPGTYQARMTILFHELAHHLNIAGFLNDGGLHIGQSEKNTLLLLQHCTF